MNDRNSNWPMMMAAMPTPLDGERAVQQARRMFARTLANWTCDLLELRRREITRVVWPQQDIAAIRRAA